MAGPALPPGLPSGLPFGQPAEPADLAKRRRQGQITFAATMQAVKGGCECPTCKLLRRAVGEMMEEFLEEPAADAQGDNPPA